MAPEEMLFKNINRWMDDRRRTDDYGKPFYYLLGNVDILCIYKISYKVYKISKNILDI